MTLSVLSCGSRIQPAAQDSNAALQPARIDKPQSMIGHAGGNQSQPAGGGEAAGGDAKWSQSGEAIDTAKLDSAIAAAEAAAKAKPADETAKKAAGEAYFNRGMALTEARQYAAALGDFRRALKFDPNNADSKKWIDQITSIYTMLKKEAPKEGEEPKPLPWKA